jgi:hypothetical protein
MPKFALIAVLVHILLIVKVITVVFILLIVV